MILWYRGWFWYDLIVFGMILVWFYCIWYDFNMILWYWVWFGNDFGMILWCLGDVCMIWVWFGCDFMILGLIRVLFYMIHVWILSGFVMMVYMDFNVILMWSCLFIHYVFIYLFIYAHLDKLDPRRGNNT